MPVRLLALLLAALVAVPAASAAPSPPGELRPPVVVLVLDEFPADALTGPDGRIDAARFPAFAALARSSTWLRGGYTVFDSTTKAMPAIVDARRPRPGTAPGFAGHPESIFTLLDGLGYTVVATESVSPLCPPEVCAGSAPGTAADVLARLRGAERPAALRGWVGEIRPRGRPALYFNHSLLPHEPWIYLPSGRQSRPAGKDPVGAVNRPIGFHDPGLTDHNHLRHLLQVAAVDHELGGLLRRLRRTGLFDRALLVVLADHGYSFEVGASDRRQVTSSNIGEIAPVPFFVKAPGQRDARVDDRLVPTLAVVPTVAALLGARVPWPHEGRSALHGDGSTEVAIPRRDFSRVVAIGRGRLERKRRDLRLRRARKFGSGALSELFLGDPWAAAYRIGPHPELLGRTPGRVPAAGPRARVAGADLLRAVGEPGVYPTRVVGRIDGGRARSTRDLAVAVNGRIEALGRSFRLRGQEPEYLSLMLPERALRPGRNQLVLLEVRGGRLRSLGRY